MRPARGFSLSLRPRHDRRPGAGYRWLGGRLLCAYACFGRRSPFTSVRAATLRVAALASTFRRSCSRSWRAGSVLERVEQDASSVSAFLRGGAACDRRLAGRRRWRCFDRSSAAPDRHRVGWCSPSRRARCCSAWWHLAGFPYRRPIRIEVVRALKAYAVDACCVRRWCRWCTLLRSRRFFRRSRHGIGAHRVSRRLACGEQSQQHSPILKAAQLRATGAHHSRLRRAEHPARARRQLRVRKKLFRARALTRCAARCNLHEVVSIPLCSSK